MIPSCVLRACRNGVWPAACLAIAALFPLHCAAAVDPSSAGAPVSITECGIDEQNAMLNGKIGFRDSTVAGFIIRYTVNSATAAREVRFVVRYDGKNLPLVDRGTFAPHMPIKREFDKYTPAYAGDAAECRVTSVTFADGTRWDAPGPPAAPANR